MSPDTVIGIVFGVIGLIAGYVFYRKGMKIKDPVYSIKSNNVISGYSSKYKNLTVSYKKTRVENFTVSKVLIFNRGAETITRQDITTLNQIKIITNVSSIMDATVIETNNPSSDFKISLDKTNSVVTIDFDYLDKNHGAVIEIIHTGLSSSDIELVGDIKGAQKLSLVPPEQLKTNFPMASQKGLWGILVAILLAGLGIMIFAKDYLDALLYSNLLGGLFWITLVLAFLISAFLIPLGLITYVVSLFTINNEIPKGLEKFKEE